VESLLNLNQLLDGNAHCPGSQNALQVTQGVDCDHRIQCETARVIKELKRTRRLTPLLLQFKVVENMPQQAFAWSLFDGGLHDTSVARVNEIDKLIEGSSWARLDMDARETIDVLVEYHARIRQDLLESIGTSGHRTPSLQKELDLFEDHTSQVLFLHKELDQRSPYALIGYDFIQTQPFEAATWLFLGVEKDKE
jgi:hypothetical protein